MLDKRVVDSNLKRSSTRGLLSTTGKAFLNKQTERLQRYPEWLNFMQHFPK
jgi:hypothetical protein